MASPWSRNIGMILPYDLTIEAAVACGMDRAAAQVCSRLRRGFGTLRTIVLESRAQTLEADLASRQDFVSRRNVGAMPAIVEKPELTSVICVEQLPTLPRKMCG